MTTNEFSWKTADGLKIFAKEWKVEFPKAVIALIHGLGEHCNRYHPMAEFFAQHNIAMVGYDRRGHGKSEGKRGHTTNYAALLDEVDTLIEETKSRYPVSPIFLYGHSMGGNILLKHLISRKPAVKGAISSATFITFPGPKPKLKLAIGRLIRRIFPSLSQKNDLDVTGISSDPKEVEIYKNDPLVHDQITFATAIDMVKTAEELEKYKGKLRVPTLLIHGSADRLAGVAGSRMFVENVSGDVTYKEWDGGYHELHYEPNRKEVLDYTLNWIRKYL